MKCKDCELVDEIERVKENLDGRLINKQHFEKELKEANKDIKIYRERLAELQKAKTK